MMRLDSRCLGSWIVALSAVACTSVPTRERDAMTERDATVTADATVATDATTTPDTTTIDDRQRENFDRHAAYVVVAFVAGA